MSQNEQGRLIAAVTIKLPNRQVAGRWMPGAMILAGKPVPTEGLDPSHIQSYLDRGLAYREGQIPQLKDVAALRPEDNTNVSAVVKADGSEENPLDDGIELVGSDRDPALQDKLDEIAAEQAEEGVESDDSEPEPVSIEVNAETGEVSETGGEPEFDEDEADAQVS